ncbi:glycosyltransferase [Campylobacter sp. 9BO]|uniref:glycosyltransferase n=1 Tax=Campylobacter sp. 9BO TaxID=3424759 RepID=UPI003D341190
MKILIVNAYEKSGGAAKSAYRLYQALLEHNIDAMYYVFKKDTTDTRIFYLGSKFDKLKAFLANQIDQLQVKIYSNRKKMLFSPNNTLFNGNNIEFINSCDADIVHFHWVNGGMININDISKIKKPLVWTMHDSWLFTGGCHIPYDCDNFLTRCSYCQVLGSRSKFDLSSLVFDKKSKVLLRLNLYIVSPSIWLYECAKDSMLLRNKSIQVIPNPIDTNIFFGLDKDISRKIVGLSDKFKKIILFSASFATIDENKGFSYIYNIAQRSQFCNYLFVIIGGYLPMNLKKLSNMLFFGNISDEITMNLFYNCADVTVVPSRSENLSNTIMESLSCGTPVAAFDIGGNADMVEHMINGYLAKPFDCDDLSFGIEWILNCTNYKNLAKNARKKVVNKFDKLVISKKYIDLYRQIFNKKNDDR